MLLALVVVFFLLVGMLWHCCSSYCDVSRQDEEEEGRVVVAREVRPGLILVQGYPSQEDTLRIVSEYDAMYSGVPSMFRTPRYEAQGTAPTSYVYPQPHASFYTVSPSAPGGHLVDLAQQNQPSHSSQHIPPSYSGYR